MKTEEIIKEKRELEAIIANELSKFIKKVGVCEISISVDCDIVRNVNGDRLATKYPGVDITLIL